MTTGKEKKNLAYTIVTERICFLIEKALEDKTLAPWHKPWDPSLGMPRNIITKKPYRGINNFLLGCSRYTSPFWATWKQVKGKIKADEKKNSTVIVFYKSFSFMKGKEGEEKEITIPYLRYYRVFNFEQMEGIKEPEIESLGKDHSPIRDCERILEEMTQPAEVIHGDSKAYYRPSTDKIFLPNMKAFDNPESYYSTRFHETIHSTGHESRLNRPGITDCTFFGSTNYSFEELVAEMGAAFLCGIAGIENRVVQNSASYLKSWLRKFNQDKKMLVRAAAQAQKAVDYIVGTTFEKSDETEKVA